MNSIVAWLANDHATSQIGSGPTIFTQFDRRLRKLRASKGWSQEEMAFRCGGRRTCVGGVERGEYNASILTIRR